MRKKVVIIHVMLGNTPPWFGYFLAGTGFNPGFTWLIFMEDTPPAILPDNVKIIPIDREKLAERIESRLGIKNLLQEPRKLCDFKPAYGKLFREYIAEAGWWGYCDSDMVFGRLDDFIPLEWFDTYRIISTYSGYLSGPLAFFRNTDTNNNLFSGVPAYREVLQHPECLGFDEHLESHPARKSPGDYFLFPGYCLGSLLRKNTFPLSFREIKYRYFWKIKKRHALKSSVLDMTDMVHLKNGTISNMACFSDILCSDAFFSRVGMHNWNLEWDRGRLTETSTGNELGVFHFRKTKEIMKTQASGSEWTVKNFKLNAGGFHE